MVDEFQDTNPRAAADHRARRRGQPVHGRRRVPVDLLRSGTPTWSCSARAARSSRRRGGCWSCRRASGRCRELLDGVAVAFAGALFGDDYVALLPANAEAEAAAEADAVAQLTARWVGRCASEPGPGAARRDPRDRQGQGRGVGCDRPRRHAAARHGVAARGGAAAGAADPRARGGRPARGRHRGARARDGRHGGDRARARRRGRADVPDRRARLLVPAPGRRPHRLPRGARQPARRPAPLRGARLAARAGASSDTLALLADAARPGSAWDRLAEPEPIAGLAAEEAGDACARSPSVSSRTASSTARLPLDGLIERVIADTGYDLAVLQLPGGERRLANVRKLLRLAREFEAQEGRDLRGLVDLVEALAGRSSARTARARRRSRARTSRPCGS